MVAAFEVLLKPSRFPVKHGRLFPGVMVVMEAFFVVSPPNAAICRAEEFNINVYETRVRTRILENNDKFISTRACVRKMDSCDKESAIISHCVVSNVDEFCSFKTFTVIAMIFVSEYIPCR